MFYVPFTVRSSILDVYQTKWTKKMFDLKWLVVSDEHVQTDLLLLSAGPPPMTWVNRSSAHEWEIGISVKPTRNVIMHDVPNFYFPPLPPYKIRASTFYSDNTLSFYLPFIHHRLSAGNLFTYQCQILNKVIRHITVSIKDGKQFMFEGIFFHFGIDV